MTVEQSLITVFMTVEHSSAVVNGHMHRHATWSNFETAVVPEVQHCCWLPPTVKISWWQEQRAAGIGQNRAEDGTGEFLGGVAGWQWVDWEREEVQFRSTSKKASPGLKRLIGAVGAYS